MPSPLLNHAPMCHIQISFKCLQGKWFHQFPRQPVPVPDKLFGEEIFHNIQSKHPLAQHEAISSCLIPCYSRQKNWHPHCYIVTKKIYVSQPFTLPESEHSLQKLPLHFLFSCCIPTMNKQTSVSLKCSSKFLRRIRFLFSSQHKHMHSINSCPLFQSQSSAQ